MFGQAALMVGGGDFFSMLLASR